MSPLKGFSQWEIRCEESALVIRPIKRSEEVSGAEKEELRTENPTDVKNIESSSDEAEDKQKRSSSIFDFDDDNEDKDPIFAKTKTSPTPARRYTRKSKRVVKDDLADLVIKDDLVIPYEDFDTLGVP